jgi:hypothetical protein
MTYQKTVEHYGDEGLINTEVISFDLTGEDEQQYLSPERLRNVYSTLRQWSADAQNTYDLWPTLSNAQKDARARETYQRLGVFLDRLADLLLLEGRS